MTIEIKDELNNIDISPAHIIKVIEEKTSAYPNFKTFVVIYFVGGESATLKGWTLDKWREFKARHNG
jgi:hypothetical protein